VLPPLSLEKRDFFGNRGTERAGKKVVHFPYSHDASALSANKKKESRAFLGPIFPGISGLFPVLEW
jgi:hypothetical protein